MITQLFLTEYTYFKEKYKLTAIDLSKQQTFDASTKAIQLINSTENLHWAGNTKVFFIIEEVKESILVFSQGTVRVLWIFFALI